MLVPGILKLGRVTIMLHIWHLDFMHFFSPVMVCVVEILFLTSICLRLGGCLYAQRVVLLNKCLAAGMLLQRFHSFITALLLGTMIAWYVCTRGRQIVDVCCFCTKFCSWYFCQFIPLFCDNFDRVSHVDQMCD